MELTNEAIMRLLTAQVPGLARRSVPVPTKRLGTVDTTQGEGVSSVSVLVDGDQVAVDVLNGTGQLLAQGQRVVVDFYPPNGAMVSGVLGGILSLTGVTITVTDTTDASGYITWAHGLGTTPSAVAVEPQSPISGGGIPAQHVTDTYGAVTCRTRFLDPGGTPLATLGVTFRATVFA